MMKRSILLSIFFLTFNYGTAATINWDGSESNAWENGDNWAGGVAPGASDYAVINGGTFTVDLSTTETIQGVRVINATLNISGTLNCMGATLPGIWGQGTVNNTGTVNINANHAGIQLQNGSFTNDGTLNITGSTQSGIALIVNASFTNNNILEISGVSTHGIHLQAANCTFTNAAGTTSIGGTGTIGSRGILNSGMVTSDGALNIDNCSAAGIDNSSGSFSNGGMLTIGTTTACNNRGINNSASFTNTGTITIGTIAFEGLVNNNSSTFTNSGTLNLNHGGASNAYAAPGTGALSNSGTITGTGNMEGKAINFTNSGTVSPGNSPGVFNFLHGYTNGVFEVELASTGSFDNLEFNNGSNDLFILGGTLDVQYIGGFAPLVNDVFKIIDAPNGYSNTAGENEFATINWPSPAAEWEIHYNTNDVTIEYIGVVLPIELTSFTGKAVNKGIDLKWETASEINNKGFQIEKRTDHRNWTKLTWINGNDDSFTTSNYQFTDLSPTAGTNYYRLKQIDFDEAFSYSDIVQVDWQKNDNKVILFPNPAKDLLNISVKETETIDRICIYNALGQLISNSNVSEKIIDISKLDNGVYRIQIQTDTENHWSTFVKN